MAKAKRVSELLESLHKSTGDDSVSVGDVLKKFHGRASAPLLFLLGLLLVSPLGGIPFVAPFLGALITLIAAQTAWGGGLWIPVVIKRQEISGRRLRGALNRITPWVERFEKYTHTRWTWMVGSPGDRVAAILIAIIGLCVCFISWIPGALIMPGLTVAILSVARFHRDGVWMAGGILGAMGVFATVLYALSKM